MSKGFWVIVLVAGLLAAGWGGQATADDDDPFKGKLFPPELILQHKSELDLSKQQFKEIRAAVVQVQSNIAEHEWDMAEAYQSLLEAIDERPIDTAAALRYTETALQAENEVKKMQIEMLIKLRNLLTAEQLSYLESTAQ